MTVCDSVGAFATGDLTASAAAAFRAHLSGCEPCRKALIEEVTLDARLSTLSRIVLTPIFAQLTASELTVALALAAGDQRHEIAKRMDVSVKTVDSHRQTATKKLRVKNNAELARLAIREGLVSMHEPLESET